MFNDGTYWVFDGYPTLVFRLFSAEEVRRRFVVLGAGRELSIGRFARVLVNFVTARGRFCRAKGSPVSFFTGGATFDGFFNVFTLFVSEVGGLFVRGFVVWFIGI